MMNTKKLKWLSKKAEDKQEKNAFYGYKSIEVKWARM